jgi:hypothetical protein
MSKVHYLIDSPVDMFSTREEIEDWISELKEMPRTEEVLVEIKNAEFLLKVVSSNS